MVLCSGILSHAGARHAHFAVVRHVVTGVYGIIVPHFSQETIAGLRKDGRLRGLGADMLAQSAMAVDAMQPVEAALPSCRCREMAMPRRDGIRRRPTHNGRQTACPAPRRRISRVVCGTICQSIRHVRQSVFWRLVEQ